MVKNVRVTAGSEDGGEPLAADGGSDSDVGDCSGEASADDGRVRRDAGGRYVVIMNA